MNATTRDFRISVVMPAYNAAEHIERAVSSVLDQTAPVDEVIVVNDGSTDDTMNKLKAYEHPVVVLSQPNRGASCARNTGILRATGDLIAFLDADDYWYPTKIANQITLFEQDLELGFISCEAQIIDLDGNPVNRWSFKEPESDLLHHLFNRHAGIPGSLSAVMVRKELFARVGLFDTVLTSQEDVDMWLRLAAVAKFQCDNDVGVEIQRQPGSVSSNYQSMLQCARAAMIRNRRLLPLVDRGKFWRRAFSGMLTDYAKWAYRDGRKLDAMKLLAEASVRSRAHWRLVASLFFGFLRGEKV